MKDLKLASVEEIIEELGTRCWAWVVAVDTDFDIDGNTDRQMKVRHGGKITTELGLIHVALGMLQALEMQKMQE